MVAQKSPRTRFHDLIRQGHLESDPAQEATMRLLEKLHDQLRGYDPTKRHGLFRKKAKRPRSLYIWGGVGRGKSLLMDLFFNNTSIQKKRRVHFHAFMIQTHERIAAWRAMDANTRRKQEFYVSGKSNDDPIPHIAAAIFMEAHLLCFDEFQVTDITDAMLLGRLLEALCEQGCVIVATSNRHPDHLYKDGINRELFMPAISLIKEEMDIIELIAQRDYRLDQLAGHSVYYTPLGSDTATAMNNAWGRMICGATEEPANFAIKGRTLSIARTARGTARVTFDEMCAATLGAEDYITIAETFHTVFMDDIPVLTPELRNEAKRLVTFIDALYENTVKFVCSAAAPPHDLYPKGHGAFEFQRTVSRLMEMQSEAYLNQPAHGQ